MVLKIVIDMIATVDPTFRISIESIKKLRVLKYSQNITTINSAKFSRQSSVINFHKLSTSPINEKLLIF